MLVARVVCGGRAFHLKRMLQCESVVLIGRALSLVCSRVGGGENPRHTHTAPLRYAAGVAIEMHMREATGASSFVVM